MSFDVFLVFLHLRLRARNSARYFYSFFFFSIFEFRRFEVSQHESVQITGGTSNTNAQGNSVPVPMEEQFLLRATITQQIQLALWSVCESVDYKHGTS